MRSRFLGGRGCLAVASSAVLALGSLVAAHAAPPETDEAALLPRMSAREEKFRDDRVKVIGKGSSSRSARQAAARELPLDSLAPEDRRIVDRIVSNTAVFRELPTVSFEVDYEVYRYFRDSPDVAVAIWRTMGISKFQMQPDGAGGYEADCGDGTTGKVRILSQTDEKCLILCDGVFKNPLLTKPVKSQCLLSLNAEFSRTEDNRPLVRHRAVMFVTFPSQTVETAAKVISPISNVIIDHNFREISLFVHMMSQAMRSQPGWVEKTTEKLEGISDARKQEFLKLSAQVYVRNRRRELAREERNGEMSIDEVLAPLREPATPMRSASK